MEPRIHKLTENPMPKQMLPKQFRSESQEFPSIHEIFGTLEGALMDDTNGCIVISFSKSNRIALKQILIDLQEWEGRDVYIQLRRMTKRRGST